MYGIKHPPSATPQVLIGNIRSASPAIGRGALEMVLCLLPEALARSLRFLRGALPRESSLFPGGAHSKVGGQRPVEESGEGRAQHGASVVPARPVRDVESWCRVVDGISRCIMQVSDASERPKGPHGASVRPLEDTQERQPSPQNQLVSEYNATSDIVNCNRTSAHVLVTAHECVFSKRRRFSFDDHMKVLSPRGARLHPEQRMKQE